MKKNLIKSILILLALVSFTWTGCSDDIVPSLYSPDSPAGAAPQITSVEPSTEAIAAVTPITINGQNFSTDTAEVKVYFGKKPAVILSASPTQLKVISPNISGSLKIKISSRSAVAYSNTYDYFLRPAAFDFYPNLKDVRNIPMNIILDNAENIYSFNFSIGVMQITPDSISSLYSTKGGETYWTSMRFGPGGVMYCARGLQALFSIPAGGGVKSSSWTVLTPSSLKISKIEFDPLGNLWAAGKNTDIYRIKPDKSNTAFPFNYNVTAMRVFVDNGTTFLYVAAQENTTTKIMRIPINANGDPGSPETYFDFSEKYGADYIVNDITFAADGELFLSTDLPSPIVWIKPDKSSGLLYDGILLKSPSLALAWGTGNFLYYVREQINDTAGLMLIPQTIVKLNLLKPGAPYYGM